MTIVNPELFSTPTSILISYQEVLRDPNEYVLDTILNDKKIRVQMERYLDLSRFKSQSKDHIRATLVLREVKNILEWLSVKSFEFEYNYKRFYDHDLKMYEKCTPLDMYAALANMYLEKFTEKIFVYNRVDDKRIRFDLARTFGKSDKIVFVTGNYLDVVDRIGQVDLIVDNDLDRISPLMSDPRFRRTLFMIARYGYNYTVSKVVNGGLEFKNNLNRVAAKNNIKIVEFSPFKITKELLRNG